MAGTKIKGISKMVALIDDLGEYGFYRGYGDVIPKIKADVFIHAYKGGSYDGSGVAVWRKDGKWSYQYLGHCSCNGPLEDLETSDKAKFTLKQIQKVLKAEYQWTDEVKLLSDYLKTHYKK